MKTIQKLFTTIKGAFIQKKRQCLCIFFASAIIVSSLVGTMVWFNFKTEKENHLIFEENSIDKNVILLRDAILESNKFDLITDIRKNGVRYENYFSNERFKKNIFSLIDDCYYFWEQKTIDFQYFHKNVSFQIRDNGKRVDLKINFINKSDKDLLYYSYLNFLIM